ncbi:MAG: hypothetical protein Q8M56_01480, partial [Desulfobacterales bacterium]|nr:hypothetical protein [Desulfobacterales bacterium]
DVLASEPFQEGKTCTDFIATHFEGWRQRTDEADLAVLAYIIDEIAGPRRPQAHISGTTEPVTPWQTIGNWRL